IMACSLVFKPHFLRPMWRKTALFLPCSKPCDALSGVLHQSVLYHKPTSLRPKSSNILSKYPTSSTGQSDCTTSCAAHIRKAHRAIEAHVCYVNNARNNMAIINARDTVRQR
ncbi:MAG: hypothetical protein AAF352_09080, partial [Pseudomonadota bacterium]